MRKLIYAAILVALCFAPLERMDIADLQPVQAVAMYMENDDVILETDSGNRGRGATVAEALQNLKENTVAVVYLDTAEFLLVSEAATSRVKEASQYMKPSVKVCVCNAAGRVKASAQYLDIHEKLPKLRDWTEGK